MIGWEKNWKKLRENDVPAPHSASKHVREITGDSALRKQSIVEKGMTGPSHTGSGELVQPRNATVRPNISQLTETAVLTNVRCVRNIANTDYWLRHVYILIKNLMH